MAVRRVIPFMFLKESNLYLRLLGFEDRSYSNGPGRRAVVWTQGCTLNCPGCFNPDSHSPDAGFKVSVRSLVERIVSAEGEIDGITISGGEPLQQWTAIEVLVRRIRRETGLSIILFTGYTWQEISRRIAILPSGSNRCSWLDCVDVLISGRFIEQQRVARGLAGSRNKQFHFLTDRHQKKDFENVPEAEVVIGPEGDLLLTGIDPLRWE
ncbi:MAG TPA: radical SAM protein [Verrucomicrobiales bacterium]|nr:radical SAM protein [Verrucomicrobiales bacterium]